MTLTVDGRVVPLSSDRVVVGRSRECDVRIDDGNVSRRHAELSRDQDERLDRRRPRVDERDRGERPPDLEAHAARAGDRISIGGAELVFGRTLP